VIDIFVEQLNEVEGVVMNACDGADLKPLEEN